MHHHKFVHKDDPGKVIHEEHLPNSLQDGDTYEINGVKYRVLAVSFDPNTECNIVKVLEHDDK
jgi:hypothetical protein